MARGSMRRPAVRILVVENDADIGLRRLGPWLEDEGLDLELRR